MKFLVTLSLLALTLTSFASTYDFEEMSPYDLRVTLDTLNYSLVGKHLICTDVNSQKKFEFNRYYFLNDTQDFSIFVDKNSQPAMKVIQKGDGFLSTYLIHTTPDLKTISRIDMATLNVRYKTENVGTILEPEWESREIVTPKINAFCK